MDLDLSLADVFMEGFTLGLLVEICLDFRMPPVRWLHARVHAGHFKMCHRRISAAPGAQHDR